MSRHECENCVEKKARFRLIGFGLLQRGRLRERSVGSNERFWRFRTRHFGLTLAELDSPYDHPAFGSPSEEENEIRIGGFRPRGEKGQLLQFFRIRAVSKRKQEPNFGEVGLQRGFSFAVQGHGRAPGLEIVGQCFEKRTFRCRGIQKFKGERFFVGCRFQTGQFFFGKVPDGSDHPPPLAFIIAGFDEIGDYFVENRGFSGARGHFQARGLKSHVLKLLGADGTARVRADVSESGGLGILLVRSRSRRDFRTVLRAVGSGGAEIQFSGLRLVTEEGIDYALGAGGAFGLHDGDRLARLRVEFFARDVLEHRHSLFRDAHAFFNFLFRAVEYGIHVQIRKDFSAFEGLAFRCLPFFSCHVGSG